LHRQPYGFDIYFSAFAATTELVKRDVENPRSAETRHRLTQFLYSAAYSTTSQTKSAVSGTSENRSDELAAGDVTIVMSMCNVCSEIAVAE
jgi:NACalpha-BTF3-like transcription factor